MKNLPILLMMAILAHKVHVTRDNAPCFLGDMAIIAVTHWSD